MIQTSKHRKLIIGIDVNTVIKLKTMLQIVPINNIDTLFMLDRIQSNQFLKTWSQWPLWLAELIACKSMLSTNEDLVQKVKSILKLVRIMCLILGVQ